MLGRLLPALAVPTLLLQIAAVHAGCGAAPPPDPADARPVEAPAGTAAEPAPGPAVLAVAGSSVDGVDVELLDVSRAGDAITVRWQYRTDAAEGVGLETGGDPYALARRAYLFDDANQKKYLVLEDDSGRPVASAHADEAGLTVAPGAPVTAWARFPAPPDGTDRVSLHLPHANPFENVQIQP